MTASKLKLRRDTAQKWMIVNPVLSDGEPGFEKDTGMLKIGDGITSWQELPYFVPHDPNASTTTNSIELTEHINAATPHPVYDDGPSLALLYQNVKV